MKFETKKQLECKHLKTGKIYGLIRDDVICTTNATDGQRIVLYRDQEKIFIREYSEFYSKFEIVQQEKLKDTEKIERAIEMILDYGWISGNDHKQWVIDQTLRLLTDEYDQIVSAACDYWDCGVAP